MHSRVLLHKIKFWIAASVVFFSITMGLENKIQMLHLQNHSNGKFDEEGTLKRSFVSTILLHQSRMRLAKSEAKITLLKHLHFFKKIGSGFLFGWFAFWYFPYVSPTSTKSWDSPSFIYKDQLNSFRRPGRLRRRHRTLHCNHEVLPRINKQIQSPGEKKTTVIIFLLLSLFQKS